MSRRPVPLLLDDILERSQRIARHIQGLDVEAFHASELIADAVVRNLEVIGEAAWRLPKEFCAAHAHIPWLLIVGLRHRIVHGYFDVDLDLVWQIVCHELPELENQIRMLRDALSDQG